MKHHILKLYPNALIQETPIIKDDYQCFYDEQANLFIGIHNRELNERESLLLEGFFKKISDSAILLNLSYTQKQWYNFLLKNSEMPEIDSSRLRFIHFSFKKEQSKHEFSEVINSVLQDGMILVWLSDLNGVIIEKETTESLKLNDFYSITEALLTDFFFPIDFYIGRFYEKESNIRQLFINEQIYFQKVSPYLPQQHIFYFEIAFPYVFMTTEKNKLNSILETEFELLFNNDYELLSTIKLFLENNSNTSQTAKKLYLHRNSLQYRIDKFIERTSIDIKDFQGALSVYFICLYGESKKAF